MPEVNQQNDFSRPSARPTLSAMPVQRGNYGIPPRVATAQPQPSPQPTFGRPGPRVMDVAAPPQRPQPVQQPAAVATPNVAPAVRAVEPFASTATPVTAPVIQAPAPVTAPEHIITTPKEPVFSATRSRVETKSQLPSKIKGGVDRLRLPLLILGALLVVAGGARVFTAGNISGYTIAVGAVTANDGHKTDIQFTADDGQLHHFSLSSSSRTMIPGTATQVAYQPGAADATVRQVSTVQKAHHLGYALIGGGVLSLVLGGIIILARRSKRPIKPAAETQAVPVAA